MTRLFIGFYVSVLVVLFLAWYIHGAVLKRRREAEWARLVEGAHRGGARLVASQFNAAPSDSRDKILEDIRKRFKYPVEVVTIAELPNSVQQRISGGDDIASYRPEGEQGFIVAALSGGADVVRLGPFPNYGLAEIENAVGGWMRLTAEELDAAAPGEREVVLGELKARFDIEIEIANTEELPDWPKGRIERGENTAFYPLDEEAKKNWLAVTPLSDRTEVVRFGPFLNPQRIEPNVGTTTLALVLLPVALAIALLLRPIAGQLRRVENAAKSIAAGVLSARVDQRRVRSVKPLAQAFNHMADRTETALRTQRELLQAVSHELRTPLSRIQFAIDLIREAKNDQERETRLDALDTAAQDIDELVGELLRYVRLETSQPQLELEDVPLRTLVEQLIAKQSLLHTTTSFEISEQLDTAIVVHADRASLERALGNMIGNSGRFAKSRVAISARETPGRTTIDVEDDGPGIAAEDRERVFDPFVRLDESGSGAGLGLALVRRIVAYHGGSVVAEESSTGGCRIRTIWPRSDHRQATKRRQVNETAAPVTP